MAQRRSEFGMGLAACVVLAVCSAQAMTAQAPANGVRETEFQDLLKHGFELHQQARFAEAIAVLETARRLEPGDYFANLLLGIDLLRSGKAAEAVPRLKLAARARPGEEFPEDYLGEAEAALGEDALAAEAYQRALSRGHGSEQALEAWAGFALERFRAIGEKLRGSEEGLAVARRLQDAAVKPAGPTGQTGQTGQTVQARQTRQTRCEAPISALERRLKATPKHLDADAAYKLSVCYATEAGKAAERLQAVAEDKAAVFRLRGDVQLRLKGDGAAAEVEYKQAIALRTADPALLERLAQAQLTAGETEAAQQSAKAALTIDPHRRDALRTLAALAMNNRDYEQALPLLRQLAIEAPGDAGVSVELGRALAQTGEPAEALRLLAPALGAGYPDEKGATHALLARVLRKLGRNAEAEKAETEARRLSDAYQVQSHAGEKGSNEGPDAH